MPGILASVCQQNDPKLLDLSRVMLDRMLHHPWYRTDRYCDPAQGIALARASLGLLQSTAQPVWNDDRSVCVVMEGEIYGSAELQRELVGTGSGLARDSSHAQVLLQGFLNEGRPFLRRLRGAFVAAIWDARRRRLLIINDRFGMKPLYYAHVSGRFLVASEIKSLLVDPEVSRQPNPRGIAQFFSYGQLICEDTLYSGIKTVPAAGWLEYNQHTDQLVIDKYWRLAQTNNEPAKSEREFLDRVDTAFGRAVKLQTCDSPALGISLSGGLDSRTILACIDQQVSIKSVSLGMAGSLDHRCAQRLARLSNCEHHCFLLDDTFLAHFEELMCRMVHLTDGHYLDQCIVLPTLPMYRELGIQVLLRGHAGELMHMDKAYNFSLDHAGWNIEDDLSLENWLRSRLKGYMLDNLPGPLLVQTSQGQLDSLADESLNEALKESQGIAPALHRVWHLFISQRLRRETAMSLAKIATQFETRLPFLDPDVVEALLGAPPEYKQGDKIQSYILQRRRPSFLSVVNANTGTRMGAGRFRRGAATLRMKVLGRLGVAGYQPYERMGLWLRRELRPFVERLLLSQRTLGRGIFNPQTIRAVVKQHVERRTNHTALLLALLIFELGQREFVDGDAVDRALGLDSNPDATYSGLVGSGQSRSTVSSLG